MSSTRNFQRSIVRFTFAGVLASASMALTTGCQRIKPLQPDTLSDEPVIVDEAMQIRDWDRSTAYYASGAVVAGDPRTRLEPKDDTRLNYAADPAIGLGNFVLIPFTYFRTPPFTPVVSRGTIVPPSHYAVPETRVIE